MAEIIINNGRYECAPAVASYIKQLERNNLNLQEEFFKQGAKIDELKAECTRLKKAYQKARDAIAKNYCPRCGAEMDGGADDARAGESE